MRCANPLAQLTKNVTLRCSASNTMIEAPVEFSIAVLCYRAEEEIIPFVENLHKIMSLFRFEWELLLVANFWPGTAVGTPENCQGLAERLSRHRLLAERN